MIARSGLLLGQSFSRELCRLRTVNIICLGLGDPAKATGYKFVFCFSRRSPQELPRRNRLLRWKSRMYGITLPSPKPRKQYSKPRLPCLQVLSGTQRLIFVKHCIKGFFKILYGVFYRTPSMPNSTRVAAGFEVEGLGCGPGFCGAAARLWQQQRNCANFMRGPAGATACWQNVLSLFQA